jgi:hypothetical protein
MSKVKLDAPMKPWASPEGNGPTHITVEWAMPPATAEPAEYELQYGGRMMGKWTTVPPGLEENPSSEVRRVSGLKPNEKYLFRVRGRFAYGDTFGPWSAKSDAIKTLAEGVGVVEAEFGDSSQLDLDMKQFLEQSTMSLKQNYSAAWKHKVQPHRGDPSAAAKSFSLPVTVTINARGFHMQLAATSTIKMNVAMESIKRFRMVKPNLFELTVGMLNNSNASMTMWAHGMDTHRGEQPYHFVYELETKEGKLMGAAILKGRREAEQEEVDRMQALMAAPMSAPPMIGGAAFNSTMGGR